MRLRIGMILVVGLLAPLGVAAEASAQGAVLRLSKQVVQPNEVITVQGASFSGTAVDIRIGPTRDSEIVREGALGPSFSIDVRIPATLSAGWHLMQATQVTGAGRHRGFTPGRARLFVVRPAAGAGVPPPGNFDGPGGVTPLLIALGALILLAGTSTLTVRRFRTLNRPLGN